MKRKGEVHGDDVFMNEDDARRYFERVQNRSTRRFDEFLKTLRTLNITGRYLDVGSGPGVLTQMVARQHPKAEIKGLDISPAMVKIAEQSLAGDLKDRVSYQVGDACNKVSMAGLGTFDLIFSTFTMHHWSDATKAIQNLKSMLRENGAIYIYDLKRVWWLYYTGSDSGFFKSIRASYTPGEIKKIMENIGAKKFTVKTVFPWFLMNVILREA